MDKKTRIHWVDHDSVMPKQLKIFLKNNIFTDANFVAEGKVIQVHKLVMASASSVFMEMFRVNQRIYELDMLTYDELTALIEYIYTGIVDVQKSKIPRFVQVCKMFQLVIVFVDKPKQEGPVVEINRLAQMKTATTTQTTVSVNYDDKEFQQKLIEASKATSKQTNIAEKNDKNLMVTSTAKKRKLSNFDYEFVPEFKKRLVIAQHLEIVKTKEKQQPPVRTPGSYCRRLNF